MTPDVYVVSTGTANVASVMAGLRRAGGNPIRTADPAIVRSARRMVVPGVGAFAAAMDLFRSGGLAEALKERTEQGKPLLAICLGLQLLADSSEESPGVAGIGAIQRPVVRLAATRRLPQLGWIEIEPAIGSRLLSRSHAYFANSFCLRDCDGSWRIAHADNGGRFIAAIERDAQLACQFHPELSGAWGVQLMARWLLAC